MNLRVSGRRRAVHLVVGGLVALAFATAVPNALTPWLDIRLAPGMDDVEPFRWVKAVEGSVDAVLLVSMVAVLAAPTTMLLPAQFLLASTVLAAVTVTPFVGPSFLITVGLLTLFLAVHPQPRRLLTETWVNPAPALVMLALLTAVLLVPLAGLAFRAQINGADGAVAETNSWVTAGEHYLLLALAGLLSATRRPGWQVLCIATGTVLAFLAVAAASTDGAPGSVGTFGLVALVPATGFLAAAATERRRTAAAPHDARPDALRGEC